LCLGKEWNIGHLSCSFISISFLINVPIICTGIFDVSAGSTSNNFLLLHLTLNLLDLNFKKQANKVWVKILKIKYSWRWRVKITKLYWRTKNDVSPSLCSIVWQVFKWRQIQKIYHSCLLDCNYWNPIIPYQNYILYIVYCSLNSRNSTTLWWCMYLNNI